MLVILSIENMLISSTSTGEEANISIYAHPAASPDSDDGAKGKDADLDCGYPCPPTGCDCPLYGYN